MNVYIMLSNQCQLSLLPLITKVFFRSSRGHYSVINTVWQSVETIHDTSPANHSYEAKTQRKTDNQARPNKINHDQKKKKLVKRS